jgi:hypothetical protein
VAAADFESEQNSMWTGKRVMLSCPSDVCSFSSFPLPEPAQRVLVLAPVPLRLAQMLL